MTEQHNEQAPEKAAPVNADVAIDEANHDSVDSEGSVAPLGRPPFLRIFYGVLAVVVTATLWVGAGSLKKQACLDELTARYPVGSGMSLKASGMNASTMKGHLKECTNSPF
ncbi:MAG: hypothetical protein WCI34_07940 [Actinomycetes bacterium]